MAGKVTQELLREWQRELWLAMQYADYSDTTPKAVFRRAPGEPPVFTACTYAEGCAFLKGVSEGMKS